MLLDVRHLDVAYGLARAVSDASIHIDRGEMVFLVGRNGAGKTTLLRTIAGFLRAAAGEIAVDGKAVGGAAPEVLARDGIRYVFQDKRVFTRLTVRENVQLAAFASKVPLADALERVVAIHPRIARFLDAPAGGLSGGQRQLLLIGRALIGDPKLLLIDEPTEGLAAGTIDEVFEALSSTKGKVAMLIVEQNLPVVRELGGRVYAMKEGRIAVELTKPGEIRDPSRLEAYL